MSTISSTVGLIFTVVSAKNIGPSLLIKIYIPAILFNPSSTPITLRAGLIESL